MWNEKRTSLDQRFIESASLYEYKECDGIMMEYPGAKNEYLLKAPGISMKSTINYPGTKNEVSIESTENQL